MIFKSIREHFWKVHHKRDSCQLHFRSYDWKESSRKLAAINFFKPDLYTHSFTEVFRPLPSYLFGCLPCSELGQWLHDTFYGLHNKREQSICHPVKCPPWGLWQSCVQNIVMTFDIAEKATVYWGKILMARNGNGQHSVLCYFTWIMCLAVTI